VLQNLAIDDAIQPSALVINVVELRFHGPNDIHLPGAIKTLGL
jgi:hypothetical protein